MGRTSSGLRRFAIACVAVGLHATPAPAQTGESLAADRADKLFGLRSDEAAGVSRRVVDLADTGFSFSALMPEGVEISLLPGASEGDPIARILDPKTPDEPLIEIRQIDFPAFADASNAGTGFLSMMDYDRILENEAAGNNALAHLGGFEEEDGTGRAIQMAAVSGGTKILFVTGHPDEDDEPNRESLARFFGTLRLDTPPDFAAAFTELEARTGDRLLVPREWRVQELGSDSDEKASGWSLTLDDDEFPDLLVLVGPGALEKGRRVAAGLIREFTEGVEASPSARFTAESESRTYPGPDGEPVAHSYVRTWTADTGQALVSEVRALRNLGGNSASVLTMNTPDAMHGTAERGETAKMAVMKDWVVARSGLKALRLSLAEGPERFLDTLNVRAAGR